jgi:uncharacterized caspase-like protein
MTENNWAIVIGINAYKFLPPDDYLKYAVNDAVKMRQFLCEQAKFPKENVLLCCDISLGEISKWTPDKPDIRHLLQTEIKRAKGANNFWFFYAGHGIVQEHQDFLLPHDGNPDDLEATAIPISFVTNCLRDCGAENVVLVMDMCRNRSRSTDEGSRDIGQVMGEQTRKIAKEQGIVTLFSCSRGERSYEIKELEQGAFTYALLEGLKQSTTPKALEEYLTIQLPALNRLYGKPSQKPMVNPEPGWKYNRPLLLSCATPTDIQQLAVEAMDAELENKDYEKAKALWRQVIEADRSTQSDRTKALKAINRINSSIRKEEAECLFEQERQELASEKGINYTKLRDLLQAKQWKDADHETYLRMLEAVGRKDGDWVREEELPNFPCADLQTIDRLWVKYSKGHFGFSVQEKIWQECCSSSSISFGKKCEFTPFSKVCDCFCVSVGWQNSELQFDPKKSPVGELPGGSGFWSLSMAGGARVAGAALALFGRVTREAKYEREGRGRWQREIFSRIQVCEL